MNNLVLYISHILLMIVYFVKCDLPVHCLKHDVYIYNTRLQGSG